MQGVEAERRETNASIIKKLTSRIPQFVRPLGPLSVSIWSRISLYSRSLPIWGRYGLATLLVLATAAFPYQWGADGIGHPFVLFFPAIVTSALFFAQGSGIWAALLSTALIGSAVLGTPERAASADFREFWAVVLFLVVGTGTASMIEMLHNSFFALAQLHLQLKAAHDRIAAAEVDKDVLLQEMGHRFKNELATLIALLRLQARTVADPIARTELLAASDRVHVMGRVHERLTRPGDQMLVDIRGFLTDLVEDLRASLIGARPITLRSEIGGGTFSIAQAVSIGMITNELVTNALKHGFPGDRAGIILVRFFQEKSAWRLVVRDNGVGIPVAQSRGSQLGERLIWSLARQLEGTFEVDTTVGGRSCSIHFPT